MNRIIFIFLLMVAPAAFADSLPSFSLQPASQTMTPGTTATFIVAATGASSYQWMFNGTNIPGATSATLQVNGAQSTNSGYYNVIAKNAIGWTPSQLVYLFLDYTFGGLQPTAGGVLPLSNTNNIYFAGDIDSGYDNGAPNNGTVQIVVGLELDQMRPVGPLVRYRSPPFPSYFYNGYYNAPDQYVATIKPGQTVYYGVIVSYTNTTFNSSRTFPSTIMKLVAGTNNFFGPFYGPPTPSCYGLKFPGWFPGEGVEPGVYLETPASQLRVVGETVSFTNSYFAYTDYGYPTAQWRKNGVPILNATNHFGINPPSVGGEGASTLTITNVQVADAGIYDVIIYGSEWVVSPKITLSIQTTNGSGVFQNPRSAGTNFICDLLGAASRNYKIQQSSNLLVWTDLVTLLNLSGTVTFTNSPASSPIFYRTVLLP